MMLFKTKMLPIVATVMLASVAIPASAATLLGDTVTCSRNAIVCDTSTSTTGGTTTVGSGIEFKRGAGTFDFNATGVVLTLVGSNGFADPLVYSFTDSTSAFTSFSNLLISGTTNVTASDVSLVDGVLAFNLGGRTAANGATVSLALQTAASAVPEPATWAMMILGMGAIGFAMRSAKRRSDRNFDAKIKRITDGALA